MRGERKLVELLTNAGLDSTEAIKILTHEALSRASASQVLEGMFDAGDRQEGGDLIVWLNDLETEERYVSKRHLGSPTFSSDCLDTRHGRRT